MDELDDIYDEVLDENDFIEKPEPKVEDIKPPGDDDFLNELNPPKKEEDNTNSVLDALLKERGIEREIKLITEDDKEELVDFFDLTESEQLDILNTKETIEVPEELGEQETALLKHLKDNNISLDDYLKNYAESEIQKLKITSTDSYEIDAYGDEELFLLDLKERYGIDDEDILTKELEKELENKDVFDKKISKIRDEYKKLEDSYKQQLESDASTERENKYNTFVDSMVKVADSTEDLHGIELEDSEKSNVLSFLLELDDNGTSEFYRSLDDPKKLYEAAWFLKYGADAFNAYKEAYESEITKLKTDKPIVRVERKDKKGNNEINSIYNII